MANPSQVLQYRPYLNWHKPTTNNTFYFRKDWKLTKFRVKPENLWPYLSDTATPCILKGEELEWVETKGKRNHPKSYKGLQLTHDIQRRPLKAM